MFTRVRLFLLTQLCVLMSGCYEYPDGECISPTDVTVASVVLDLPIEPYPSGVNRADDAEKQDLDVRVIIGVYTKDGSLVEKKIISAGRAGAVVYPIDMTFYLPGDEYRLVFWADYTQHNSVADLYYDTEDLTTIMLRDEYVGGTEAKDAYTTYKDINLSLGGQMDETIILRRPFARYQIIATDLDKFIEMGGIHDIENMQVKINYPGFIYDVYDAFRGMPVDLGGGPDFISHTKILPSGEMLLAWDYVWANEEESVLKTNMIIYDKEGQIINKVDKINIPYMRNKLTTVKGSFLTEESDSGIGVITDYEGDIDIPLP